MRTWMAIPWLGAALTAGRTALAGDCPLIVVADRRGGLWGIGELSDQVLIYLGGDTFLTSLPTWTINTAALLAAAVLVALVLVNSGPRRLVLRHFKG